MGFKKQLAFFILIFCGASAHAVCIRSMRYENGTLTILGIGTDFFQITKADVIAHFQSETGTVAQRKTATILWLKAQIVAALPSTINPSKITLDVDTATGDPSIQDVTD